MGLIVLIGGLSLASFAAQAPATEPERVSAPRHTHTSAATYRLPESPGAAGLPSNTSSRQELGVRGKERLPLTDNSLPPSSNYRKQGNTSFAMRVVGLHFNWDF